MVFVFISSNDFAAAVGRGGVRQQCSKVQMHYFHIHVVIIRVVIIRVVIIHLVIIHVCICRSCYGSKPILE